MDSYRKYAYYSRNARQLNYILLEKEDRSKPLLLAKPLDSSVLATELFSGSRLSQAYVYTGENVGVYASVTYIYIFRPLDSTL